MPHECLVSALRESGEHLTRALSKPCKSLVRLTFISSKSRLQAGTPRPLGDADSLGYVIQSSFISFMPSCSRNVLNWDKARGLVNPSAASSYVGIYPI